MRKVNILIRHNVSRDGQSGLSLFHSESGRVAIFHSSTLESGRVIDLPLFHSSTLRLLADALADAFFILKSGRVITLPLFHSSTLESGRVIDII